MKVNQTLTKGTTMDIIIREFTTDDVTLTVKAEVVNTEREFKWRLVCNKEKTDWSKYYAGVLTLEVNGRLFGFVTQYWQGYLPTEEPFEIIKGNAVSTNTKEFIS